jgi:3D (Asp-Asp-Asp) domain-containing protein
MPEQTRTNTARRRRRARAIAEGVSAVVLMGLAGWSGSLMKRSWSAPPAAAVDRIALASDGADADVAAGMHDDALLGSDGGVVPTVAATGEANFNEAFVAGDADDESGDADLGELPTGVRERVAELQRRGVIRGDVRVERLEPAAGVVRYFDGRPVRPARRLWMTVTAYSPDERSCGIWADGITASNKSVWTNAMQLVAADTRILPFGTLLSLDEYADGEIVPVLDRGGAIKGMRLDVLYATHAEALQFGVKRVPVTVWEYAD